MRKKKSKLPKPPRIIGRGHVAPLCGLMVNDNVIATGSVRVLVNGTGHTFDARKPNRTQ